jgi:hypothetical protein
VLERKWLSKMKRIWVTLAIAFLALQIYLVREAIAVEFLLVLFLSTALLLVALCYAVGAIFETLLNLMYDSMKILRHARRGLCFGWSVLSESCTNGLKKLDW